MAIVQVGVMASLLAQEKRNAGLEDGALVTAEHGGPIVLIVAEKDPIDTVDVPDEVLVRNAG